MAISLQPYIEPDISETSIITVNNDNEKTYTVTLDANNNSWFRTTPARQINQNDYKTTVLQIELGEENGH